MAIRQTDSFEFDVDRNDGGGGGTGASDSSGGSSRSPTVILPTAISPAFQQAPLAYQPAVATTPASPDVDLSAAQRRKVVNRGTFDRSTAKSGIKI